MASRLMELSDGNRVVIEFVRTYRNESEGFRAYEFRTSKTLHVDGNNSDFFRLDVYDAGDICVHETSEYAQGLDEGYVIYSEASHFFDLAELAEFAKSEHRDNTMYDEQLEYDRWLDNTDNGDDDDEWEDSMTEPDHAYEMMEVERDKELNPPTSDVDLGFDQSAPYAEMENWQWVLANVNEMPCLFPGDTTDIEHNIRTVCERRIEWLRGLFPRIEDYTVAWHLSPNLYDSEEAKRADYLQDIARFCKAWPGRQLDNGEITIDRDKVGTVLRTLYAYKVEHGQMQCDGWDDGDYQEVTWEMYIDWMRDDNEIPEEHERFIIV